MTTKPTVRAYADLYAVAVDLPDPVRRQEAVERIVADAATHGYTEGQLFTELFYPGSSVTPDFFTD